MLRFDQFLCSEPSFANAREWLVTNGTGSYAAGTVSGILTRRYHGLLIAALNPPLNRTLLVNKLDVSVTYLKQDISLASNQWSVNKKDCDSLNYLQRFELNHSIPTWQYAFADALLEQRIWMEPGQDTTYVQFAFTRGSAPLALTIHVSVSCRDHHENIATGELTFDVKNISNGIEFAAEKQQAYVLSDTATAVTVGAWMQDYFHAIEDFRGLSPEDAQFRAATFDVVLEPGQMTSIIASRNANTDLDTRAALQRRRDYEQDLLQLANAQTATDTIRQLVLAADQFIAARPTKTNPDGKTIIAGFPWFADWGRDTMISLPGLTLSTGRYDVAQNILQTYAQFVDKGMLPNRFPEAGEAPEYNTVDATLWYFHAIYLYHEHTSDDQLLKALYPTLASIIDWHQRGTRYGIRVDPEDGLLFAGELGSQLTWMDVKIKDWVVTPRQGKAVEVNALWLNALSVMQYICNRLGLDATLYNELYTHAAKNFKRFWNPATGYCFDVIDTDTGDDPSLRPNQLIALALPNCPLSQAQQELILLHCTQQLYTTAGIRTLAPDEKDYIGNYGGDRVQRDSAYHQGTVWAWLVGPFIDATLNVTDDTSLTMSYLEPLLEGLLTARCIGTIAEIFEGNAPHQPRGAFAQAWSVAELLRTWQRLNQRGIMSSEVTHQ